MKGERENRKREGRRGRGRQKESQREVDGTSLRGYNRHAHTPGITNSGTKSKGSSCRGH